MHTGSGWNCCQNRRKMMRRAGTAGVLFVLVFLLSIISSAYASGPIELITETGEINKLKFVNYENFWEPEGQKNDMVDEGDWFEGIFKVQSISNIPGSMDLTSQLNDIELTGHFKFSVVGDSSRPMFGAGHNDYALLENGGGGTSDFIKFYTGSGADKNWDPSAGELGNNAIDRATDGDLWLSIMPSEFFEGVNDAFNASYNFAESWANVTVNNTGYTILPQLFPAIFDPHSYYNGHTNMGETHDSHTSDIYFQNHTSGSDIPQWQIRSEDPVYMAVAPEPLSSILFVVGGVTLGLRSFRKKIALVQ